MNSYIWYLPRLEFWELLQKLPKLILSLGPINFVQTLNYHLITDRLTVATNFVHILQFHTFFSAYFTFRPFQFVGQHTDHNRNLAKEHELAEWIEIYGGVALGVAIETFSNVLKIMFIHREVWKKPHLPFLSLSFSFSEFSWYFHFYWFVSSSFSLPLFHFPSHCL